MIYLDKYVGNQYVEDIFVGVAGAPDDPNPIIDLKLSREKALHNFSLLKK